MGHVFVVFARYVGSSGKEKYNISNHLTFLGHRELVS
jgi:hypothetical protein